MMSFEYWYFLNSDKRKISISILYIPVNVCPCKESKDLVFLHYPQEKFWVDVYVIFVCDPLPVVKRGRGRPRRYPPPGQSSLPTQIPAVIIPGSNGQTIMMAPVQVCKQNNS